MWSTGAIFDFNGESNTSAIIQGHSDGTLSGSLGKAVKDFREGSNNESYTDWFVPSCGELAFMYLRMNEINVLFNKMSGTALSSVRHWSSSEHDSNYAWCVTFSNGFVKAGGKSSNFTIRLVRAI